MRASSHPSWVGLAVAPPVPSVCPTISPYLYRQTEADDTSPPSRPSGFLLPIATRKQLTFHLILMLFHAYAFT